MEKNETIRDQTGIARQRVMADLFLGAGFLGTAALDGYHARVTSAAFKPFMPTDLPHAIPWRSVVSRQYLCVFPLLSVLAWLREQRRGDAGRIGERPVYPFAGALDKKVYAQ